jgi:hypothetical protein
MATSAAESRSQTESLFAENNEPFFNTIDPRRISKLTSLDGKPHMRSEGHRN